MARDQRRIAREVKEILAGTSRPGPHRDRGMEAYRNIQGEARLAENEARLSDNAAAVAAQQSPRTAHSLVSESMGHAETAKIVVEKAGVWVSEARGAPEFNAVERVLASVRNSAARAKLNATATKRSFEERFGKYDPRGVTDQNMSRRV